MTGLSTGKTGSSFQPTGRKNWLAEVKAVATTGEDLRSELEGRKTGLPLLASLMRYTGASFGTLNY